MTEIDVDITLGPVRVVPVPASFVDQLLINGPCTLYGWSLRDAAADIPNANTGQVTSPAAGATIIALTGLQAGTYKVSWEVGLGGTLAAGDANNFLLRHNSLAVLLSVNPAAAGSFIQIQTDITVAPGDSINIVANAIGTVGAVYTASLAIEPASIPNASAELQDGNNPLGEIAVVANAASTEFFGDPGIHVRNRLNYHPVTGLMVGAVYVRYDTGTG